MKLVGMPSETKEASYKKNKQENNFQDRQPTFACRNNKLYLSKVTVISLTLPNSVVIYLWPVGELVGVQLNGILQYISRWKSLCSSTTQYISWVYFLGSYVPIWLGQRIQRLHLCREVRSLLPDKITCLPWVAIHDAYGQDLGVWAVDDPGYWEVIGCNTPLCSLLELDSQTERPNRFIMSSSNTYTKTLDNTSNLKSYTQSHNLTNKHILKHISKNTSIRR